MHSQLSGSFNTAAAEIEAVKEFIRTHGVFMKDVKDVRKYDKRDDGDVIVEFYGDREPLLFEVKYESPDRFKRYGEYGFEGGTYSPFTGRRKPSKAEYSKADIWLFYSVDEAGYFMMNGYWFVRDVFVDVQEKYGEFHETTSFNYETGKRDRWISSVYFVKPAYLEALKVIDL